MPILSAAHQSRTVTPGIAQLLNRRRATIAGARVALVTHAAALDGQGRQSAELLHACPDVQIMALLAPEHGYFGSAGAGIPCRDTRHPAWHTPIYSLYGHQRKPTRRMLRACDTVIFDLQDLGYRHYTYVSTLRLVMEACAEFDKRLIVCDRPIPLPTTVDGPLLDPACASFVAAIPAPMVYGMTPAETAAWLRDALAIDVDLTVVPMKNYTRATPQAGCGIPWAAPSPAMVSPISALTYPALVFSEAFPQFHHGQQTAWSFQTLARRRLPVDRLVEIIAAQHLPGVTVAAHWYTAPAVPAARAAAPLAGIRLCVTDPARFRPITTAAAIVAALQQLLGPRALWNAPARSAFFDSLFGSDATRQALQQGASAADLAAQWRRATAAFRRTRQRYLLYP
jgi:uncharacterized protein YbbC (DUF1343 family)